MEPLVCSCILPSNGGGNCLTNRYTKTGRKRSFRPVFVCNLHKPFEIHKELLCMGVGRHFWVFHYN